MRIQKQRNKKLSTFNSPSLDSPASPKTASRGGPSRRGGQLSTRKSRLLRQAGFTIVELIVVISIFAALTGVSLFKFRDFSSNIYLQNMTQKIALQVKRAQTAGSIGQYPNLALDQKNPYIDDLSWTPSYGIYFEKGNFQFVYFFDRESNFEVDAQGVYNQAQFGPACGVGDSECLEEISLRSGYVIEQLCVNSAEYTEELVRGDFSSCEDVNELHITFTRPELAATIESPDYTGESDINDAEIIIRSPQGRRRVIIVRQIGQISVE